MQRERVAYGGPVPSTVAVITVVTGHHELARQVDALRRGSRQPDLHVVVLLDDDDPRGLPADGETPWQTLVRRVQPGEDEEPMAFAHNTGAAEAVAQEIDILVFLDDDVIPGPELVASYAEALAPVPEEDPMTPEVEERVLQPQVPTLWCGALADLREVEDGDDYDLDRLHKGADFAPDNNRVKDGKVETAVDLTRADSANLAMLAADFVLAGGFPNNQVVGEDSALAEVVRQLGGVLKWVGGATAYREHVTPPPPEQRTETTQS